MKKILFLNILFFSAFLHAQEINRTTQTITDTLIDFETNPDVVLTPETIETVPSSSGYHDTQGALEITPSGQVSYTVPIALPPSINGVGPTINLTYNSGQLGGIAGMGWNISTVSTISRVSTRHDIDGYVDGVDFDDNDRLSLDGQRLILVSGNYWEDGSVYATEVLSNNKIELVGAGTTKYFVVTYPDGSQAKYKKMSVNSDDLMYYIYEFNDVKGNVINYEYFIPGTAPYLRSYLKSIRFSSNVNGNITPNNEIVFNYVSSKRVESFFLQGIIQYKNLILSDIIVKTNNTIFRKYLITHDYDSQLGYERIVQIQEFNSENEAANPIQFEYDTTVSTNLNTEHLTTYDNNLNFNEVELSGDFDGDGRLDFMTENKLYKNLFQSGSGATPVSFSIPEKKKLVATTLGNNKLNQFQSIVAINPTLNQSEFKVYNLVGSNLSLSYSKLIQIENSFTNSESEESNMTIGVTHSGEDLYDCNYDIGLNNVKDNIEYYEGDFNGDGISEIFIINTVNENHHRHTVTNYDNWNDFTFCTVEVTEDLFKVFLLDLNPNESTVLGSKGFVDLNISEITHESKKYVADFNGDGKSDILVINENKSYKIYTINQLNSAPWHQIEIIGQGVIDAYSKTKQLLTGDFNGDSKVDIMLPDTEGGSGHTLWHIYTSNPKINSGELFSKLSYNICEYWPDTGGYFDTQIHFSNYYALDTNGDGKSDLVRIWRKYYKPSWTINDHNTQWQITTYANNIGNTLSSTNNEFPLDYTSPSDHDSDSPDLVIPVVSNYKYAGLNRDIVLVHNHYDRIFYIDFKKDVSKDIRMKKIISSNGAIQNEITYSSMEPTNTGNGGLGSLTSFYSSSNSLTYPFVELKKLPDTYLVEQVKNTVNDLVRYQDFKYHGLMFHMRGLGNLGFKKTARTEWYTPDSDKKVWSVTECNENNRATPHRIYTTLVPNGQTPFVTAGIPSGIINVVENNYYNYSSNGVYYLYLNNKIEKNYLTQTSSKISYEYDNISGISNGHTYLLPTQVKTERFGNLNVSGLPTGTSITNIVFESNVNSLVDYHIGRPLEKTSITSAYGDTFTTFERYSYNGSNLIKKEIKGNTTEEKYLVEEYEYNLVGNVTKKTIKTTGYTGDQLISSRATEFTYDSTERFIITVKDMEGLVVTNTSFHPLYGLVTEVKDPYGKISKSYYDHWGKLYKSEDYLGNKGVYDYQRQGSEFIVTETGDDGSQSMKKSDILGRVILQGARDIEGEWSYVKTEYDNKGRKYRVSEPYRNSPSLWTTFVYDDYGRLITQTLSTGVVNSLSYSNTTVTSTTDYNDGSPQKITSSTKDANGNVISSTDMGGTINYVYFSNGTLKQSSYGGNSITLEYDEWGRKSKLMDTSAGTYTYFYNALGEVLKETTPKGTTKFTLDAGTGKILKKEVLGDETNLVSSYFYDDTTKLLTKIVNASMSYFYDYDAYQRLWRTTEITPEVHYQTATTFDSFGRVGKEYQHAYHAATGKSSNRWIKNTYKNGHHWQILDDATSQVLWQTNTLNERGQLTEALMGNGTKISETYDQFGFITQSKHDIEVGGITTNLMTLNTAFNYKRGNLTSRYNSLFNWNETFSYDTSDRLIEYTDVLGNQVQQIYEQDGRIKENNIGTYNYSNSSKKYQNTSIDITNESLAYYQNRLGLFNDSMESKKGWIIYDSSIFSYDTSVSSSGNVSLKVTNTTSTEKVVNSEYWLQIDNAQPTEYTYSVKVKSDGTNPEAEIFLFMKTETETGAFTLIDQKVSATSTDWIEIEKTFLVPANIKKLNIRLDNNETGNLWFDDVRIRKTNQPTPSERELNVTYNAFKSPVEIYETGIERISFDYNIFESRRVMYYGGLETDKTQRRYRKYYSGIGGMELKEDTETGNLEFITYLGGDAYSAPVVLKSDGTTQEFLYLHRDYLGSILAITNQSGNVVEKRLFDAWGEVIEIQDGNNNVLTGFAVLDRGYTGHEHLQSVALVHMNGRLYDAKLHRFLQPDNFVQDPYNTQNYNRYGYVLNNPLKYVDPSGEELISLTAAVLIGAFIGAGTYTITALVADVPFSPGGFIKAALIGAASGAVTNGIGTYAQSISQIGSRITFQALAHGSSQMFFSGIQGGDLLVGFASGALSSLASSFWMGGASYDSEGAITHTMKGIGGKFAESTVGTLAFGTIMGGAGARLTGGNFWQGAATGLAVTGLNHLMHSMIDGNEGDPPTYKYKGITYNEDEKGKLYFDILLDQAAEQFGIKDILALGAAIDNMGYLGKPFVTPGASTGTSFASKYGAKILPQKMPVRMFTHFNKSGKAIFTKTLGRFLGRTLGPIGWVMLTYDVGMTFYNTQQIYNKIVQ